jgi:hypothetical protein
MPLHSLPINKAVLPQPASLPLSSIRKTAPSPLADSSRRPRRLSGHLEQSRPHQVDPQDGHAGEALHPGDHRLRRLPCSTTTTTAGSTSTSSMVPPTTRLTAKPNRRTPRSSITTTTAHSPNVAAKAGVTNDRWGFGVAVGDYDNDGWPDLYVANYGKNRLYHNNHDGTFTDMAKRPASRSATGPPGPASATTMAMAASISSFRATFIGT